jgi:cytoskeletal protein CcmA (bactofilin family)
MALPRESVDRTIEHYHNAGVLKKFIPQKPLSSIGEGSLSAGTDENNGLAQREQPRTSPPTIDPQKYMAEHSGKDILSSDVEIKGTIKFQKELLIDGKVEGEINSDGVLTIGENANINGEIKTKSITVYGKVVGNITVAERCELKSRCTLQGDLKAARLVIEEGATFIGKSEVTSSTASKSATPVAARPEIVRNEEPATPAAKSAFGARV